MASQQKTTHKRKWIGVFLVAIGAICVFWKQLLLIAVKGVLLSSLFQADSREFSYESLSWEDGCIQVQDIHFESPGLSLTADRADIAVRASLNPFSLQLRCRLIQPLAMVKETDTSLLKDTSFFSRFSYVQWEVDKGTLMLNPSCQLCVDVEPVEPFAKATRVLLYHVADDKDPFFLAEMKKEDQGIRGRMSLQEEDVSQLLPFFAFLYPSLATEQWTRTEGRLQIQAEFACDQQLKLSESTCQVEVSHFAWVSSSGNCELCAEQISGSIDYCPQEKETAIWERGKGFLSIEQAKLHLPLVSACAFELFTGHLFLEPDKEPIIEAQGVCIHKGQQLDVALHGKGAFPQEHAFWLELQLQCKASTGNTAHASLSFCEHDRDHYACEAKLDSLFPEHVEFIGAAFPSVIARGKWLEGRGEGKCTLLFEDKQLRHMYLEEGKFIDSTWHMPEYGLCIASSECLGQLHLSRQAEGVWQMETADLSFRGQDGVYSTPTGVSIPIKQAAAELHVRKGEIESSWIKAISSEAEAEVIIHGKKASCFAELFVRGQTPKWLCSQPFEASATLNKKEEQLFVEAEAYVAGEKICGGASLSLIACSPSTSLFDKRYSIDLKEGWFETHPLTEDSYGVWSQWIAPGAQVQGVFQAKGRCDATSLVIDLQGSNCILNYLGLELAIPSLKESDVQVIYDRKTALYKTHISLENARLIYTNNDPLLQKTPLEISQISAAFSLDNSRLCTPCLQAVCAGISVQGALDVGWKEPGCLSFAMHADRQGKQLLQLVGLAKQQEHGWWGLSFEASKTRALGVPLNILRLICHPQTGQIACEMQPCFNCTALVSRMQELSECTLFGCAPSLLSSLELEGEMQMHLSSEHLGSDLWVRMQSQGIACHGKHRSAFHLLAHKTDATWSIEECNWNGWKGTAKARHLPDRIVLEDLELAKEGLSARATGEIDLARRGFSFSLDHLHTDIPLNSSAQEVFFESMKGILRAHGTLHGRLPEHIEALLVQAEMVCTLDLTAPLPIAIWNTQPFIWTYSSLLGHEIRDVKMFIKDHKQGSPLSTFCIEQCVCGKEEETTEAKKCQFSCAPRFIEACIEADLLPPLVRELTCENQWEGEMDVHMSHKALLCKGELKDGMYGYSGKSLAWKKLGFSLENHVLNMHGKTQCGDVPIWSTLSVSLSQDPYGVIRVADRPKADGVKACFTTKDSHLLWESVIGECAGLLCELKKSSTRQVPSASVLMGSIHLDISRLSQLLPLEMRRACEKMKLGKGYLWRGDLVLWEDKKRGFQATGELSGQEWELLGYRFCHLHAGCDLSPSRILLSNISIEDDAVSAVIKNVSLEDKQGWQLFVPLISIFDWYPSSMRKLDGSLTSDKPFFIHNLTLSNIRAICSQKDSLEGQGHFTFTNHAKKEASFLDAPLEMIKNFGLDPGILTPIQGEVELDLRGDKFYLTSLKDAFSEGGRSEFYLNFDGSPSFIDLDGKVHINLKMKQEVMLKITEPFTLTIRGTLDKLRYGLQY